MKEVLPYVALGITMLVLLFGNNIVGSSYNTDKEVQVALAEIKVNQNNHTLLSKAQLEHIRDINKTLKEHGAVINGNSKDIAVVAVGVRRNQQLLNSRLGQNSGQYVDGPTQYASSEYKSTSWKEQHNK